MTIASGTGARRVWRRVGAFADQVELVMAGLVPAINALEADKDVDARVKPAHDGQTFAYPPRNHDRK